MTDFSRRAEAQDQEEKTILTAEQLANVEPQRTGDWTVFFDLSTTGLDWNDLALAVESFSLPTEETEVLEMALHQEKVYVAGTTTMSNNSNMVVKDLIDKKTAQVIMAWRRLVYNPANGRTGWKKTQGSVSGYAVDGRLTLFGPDGTQQRQWAILNAWPSQVTWGGDLNMSSNEINTIEVTITYDKAIEIDYYNADVEVTGTEWGGI